MPVQTAPEFIDHLANSLFIPRYLDPGREYVKSRGLDPDVLSFPWPLTDGDASPFEFFRSYFPPVIFTECVYIPIPDLRNAPGEPPRLAGFDVRYVGNEPRRLRWSKRKRDPQTHLIYNAAAILKGNAAIVTESAIDAESFRTCGWEAIGALTALKSPRFAQFLYAIGRKVFLAYDNDRDGRASTQELLDYYESAGVPPVVAPLVYEQKDPNELLRRVGVEGFRSVFAAQLGS